MRKALLFLLSFCFLSPAYAEDQGLAALFAKEGVEGTIVIASLDGKREFIHNDTRANTRLAVASTFKILNSFIALEEGVITREEVLKWDGKQHPFPDWNRDHTLASAFKASCVWCYQELARRVSAQKYPPYIKKAEYGELREPFEGTTFWLDGSLTISAKEQIAFLRKVIRRSLSFNQSSYETLREIMVMEKTPAYTIRAKTGWAMQLTPPTGWYVGYIETGSNEVWIFATNIETRSDKDLPLRQQLTKASLQAKGIIK